jgi:hypothetical protein
VTLSSTAICFVDGRYRATIAAPASRRIPQQPVIFLRAEKDIPALVVDIDLDSLARGRVCASFDLCEAVLAAVTDRYYTCHHCTLANDGDGDSPKSTLPLG